MVDKGSPFGTAQFKYEVDGRVLVYVKAHKDLSARTLVKVFCGPNGYQTLPLEHPIRRYYVGMLEKSVFVGEKFWICIGGTCGNALIVHDDIEEGGLLKVEKGIVTTIHPSEYKMVDIDQFGYVVKRVCERTYNIYLVPEIVYDVN